MTTYKTMDVSDLGDNCDERDLQAFRQACADRQQVTGESDDEVTAWYWGNGDWQDRIKHPAGCSCGSPECPEYQHDHRETTMTTTQAREQLRQRTEGALTDSIGAALDYLRSDDAADLIAAAELEHLDARRLLTELTGVTA